MFNLFNPPFESIRNPVVQPRFDYLKQVTKTEVDKVVEFYRQNVNYVKPDHRLVRLLNDIKSVIDLSADQLYNNIRNRQATLCNAYGIASPYNAARMDSIGQMYNRNTPELFISVEYPIDVKKCTENWRRLKPVRVISHDFTDFSYGLANGEYATSERGMAIFQIDLAVLALQFQQWYMHERFIKERNIHLPLTHFVHRYVIVNMLSTHMDNVIFNRFMNIIKEKQNAGVLRLNSIQTNDYGGRWDSEFKLHLGQLTTKSTDWIQRLNSVPSLEYGGYLRAVSFPDVTPTRQIKWALVLAKLKCLEFLVLTDTISGNKALNIGDRVQVATQMQVLKNEKALNMFLPINSMERIDWLHEQLESQTA